MTHQAIFLDRDGVLNDAIIKDGLPYAPLSVAEVTIPADALDALKMLKKVGFLLIVVTNQPDVSRGKSTHATVNNINKKLQATLPLDDFFICFHDDADQCHCRKPLPGLLTDAAMKHDIDIARSYIIGDRWKDIEAGQAAGCQTILLDNDYLEKKSDISADYIVRSLMEAARIIISKG